MNIDINIIEKQYLNNIEKNKDFYNLSYETLFGYNELNDFIKKIPSGYSILEIGCGPGILLKIFSDIYPDKKFIGIDPFTKGFKKNLYFRKNFKNTDNFEILNESIENFKTEKKFDLIFSVNVLEHTADWKKYLIHSNKILNKDGLNIILCPNFSFPLETHYKIPIIFNKKITNFVFKNIILRKEIKQNSLGMWEEINFIKKSKVCKFLKNLKVEYELDEKILDRIIERFYYDEGLKWRHGIIGNIALFLKRLGLVNIFFYLLRIPYPYIKIIIKN